MNPYEQLIDPTSFGRVADYLHDPSSPILHVLHVRERAQLAPLAERLMACAPGQLEDPAGLQGLLAPGLREGWLRVTSAAPRMLPDVGPLLSTCGIPRMAASNVIFVPPFYLAHTPGLFEGTLIQPAPRLRHAVACRMKV